MALEIKLNENYSALKPGYLFSEVGKRVKAYSAEHPEAEIIRLGIGDVTRPLPACIVNAMKKACDEMGEAETFRGYPPEYGYSFLREAIAARYASFGADISVDEIFVSDGAKSDVGNITELFGNCEVLIPDPVYPVYFDSNVMDGRNITFVKGNAGNGFLPSPEGVAEKPCLIYICSPNNPTGASYDRKALGEWVSFALRTGSLIIYDSAYEAFISSSGRPHTIYEIDGAKSCAVEICSFSKFAGFTGVRCSWSVFPAETGLKAMWQRRQATKFNGVSYIIQRGAEAALGDEGFAACMDNIAYYNRNAKLISSCLQKCGVWHTGGVDSPYIWLRCPGDMGSWEFFDKLLSEANIVGTPGEGFGECGKGYFRLTSFGDHDATVKAVSRLEKFFGGF